MLNPLDGRTGGMVGGTVAIIAGALGLVAGNVVAGLLLTVAGAVAVGMSAMGRGRRRPMRTKRFEAGAERRTLEARPDPAELDLSPLDNDGQQLMGRLLESYRALTTLADEGMVDDDVLDDVGDRIRQLHLLMTVDHSTSRIGGRKSRRLHEQVTDLTELLVSLVDTAVDHQAASIAGDALLPVTLDDLRDAMRAATTGAEEIRRLGDPLGLEE
jgi:hypothetical protein